MLKNKNNKIIIKNIKFAYNIFRKIKGLMFSFKKNFNYALIFDLNRTTRFGANIHMFFVFFTIKVLFLNENKEIVDIKIMKPFTFYTPKKACRYVIELPLNVGYKFKVSEKLSWSLKI